MGYFRMSNTAGFYTEGEQVIGRKRDGLGKRPNVVVVVLDSLRRDHVGAYGNDWIHTPHIDALAKESIRFSNALPEALATIPARRAIHTGCRVFPFHNHQSRKGDSVRGQGWAPIPESQVTFAEIMAKVGYRTGLIIDTYHQFKPSMNFHRGFHQFIWVRGQEYDAYRAEANIDPAIVDRHSHPSFDGTNQKEKLTRYLSNIADRRYEEDYFAPKVFREAMKFVEDNREDEFFLVVDSFDPHEPWDPPQWYVDLYNPGYGKRDLIWPVYGDTQGLSEDDIQGIRALYAGEVTMTDRWLGKFLDHMDQLDLLDNTLLVVLSDHGHTLGERGVIGKLRTHPYPDLLDIILTIRLPNACHSGEVINSFAYDHDVMQTVLTALEIDVGIKNDGQDLLAELYGDVAGRSWATTAYRDRVVYQDTEHYYFTRLDRTHEHLFNRNSDPGLSSNLAEQSPDLCEELFGRILSDAGGKMPTVKQSDLRLDGPWFDQV